MAPRLVCFGGASFSPGLDLSVFIYCTRQVEFLLTPKTEHFIRRPVPPDPPSVPTERGSQPGTERLYPVQHRAGGDINVTLGEQPHDLSGRERQAAIPTSPPSRSRLGANDIQIKRRWSGP